MRHIIQALSWLSRDPCPKQSLTWALFEPWSEPCELHFDKFRRMSTRISLYRVSRWIERNTLVLCELVPAKTHSSSGLDHPGRPADTACNWLSELFPPPLPIVPTVDVVPVSATQPSSRVNAAHANIISMGHQLFFRWTIHIVVLL